MKLTLVQVSLPSDLPEDDAVIPRFRLAVATDEESGMDGHFDIAVPMERKMFMAATFSELAAFAEKEVRRQLMRGE